MTAPVRAALPDLAPRSIGRILDDAFELYRANFRAVALSSAILLFPAGMLLGVSQVFYTRGLLQTIPMIATGELMAEELNRLQLWSLLANLVSPLFLAARLYVSSMVLAAAPRMLAGERPGVREVLKGGLARFGWVLLIAMVLSIVTSFGLVLLLVPGVYLFARFALARVTCVVEAAPLDKALARSWRLTEGSVLRTLLFATGLAVITVALESAVDSPAVVRQIVASISNPEALFTGLAPGWKTFEGILTATAASLVYPFAELAWFGYYLDLRARREGMDLVATARRLREAARTHAGSRA